MAQSDNVGRTTTTDAGNAPRPQNSPGSNTSKSQTFHGGSSSWSSSSSLKLRKNHDNDEHGNQQKKSVFSKVKEKARKLKKSFSVRKRREENDLRSPNFSTPPGSAGPVKDDKQHPQFFSSPTPLQGSPVDSETTKNSSKEHPQETNKESSATGVPSKNEPPPTTDSSPETTCEGTKTATCDATDPGTSLEAKENNNQPQDKGVSVKEYLMNKLEPGEDERALSQVITQTISPKCEKMKEAVNSLLGTEEQEKDNSNSEPDTTPADSDSNDQDIGASSSTDSVEMKLTALTDHDPSNGPESRVSNVSSVG